MAEPQIRVDDLGVRYGARSALRHVSFTAAAGEIVGLLGPNGAGKTSALSVLAGLIRPAEGAAAVCGFDVVASRAEAQRVTGFVPQRLALYPSLGVINVMGLKSPESAILSAIIFNALIIIALIPLALRGVQYRPQSAGRLLLRNLLIYGVGGVIVPFIGIKAIDIVINAIGLI